MNVNLKSIILLSLVVLVFWSCEDQKAGGPKVGVVVISPKEQALLPGQSYQLSALVTDESHASLPDVEVIWISSDNAIVTVSETGLVTGIQPGLVTISASAGDVTGYCDVMVTTSRRKILSELFTSST